MALAKKDETVGSIKRAIGRRIREIREARQDTQPAVAARAGTDKGLLSNLEQGKANPTLDVFLPIIIDGLEMEWAEFCRYWVSDNAARLKQEHEARGLLESLLREGAATRNEVIVALRALSGSTDDAEHDRESE